MSCSSNRLRTALRALGVLALLVTGASATLGQGLYYKEIEQDGRIYVFNNAETAARFEAGAEIGQSIIKPGAGPNGETVVADNERALQLYYFKHGIAEPVPEPTPPPRPAPPYQFSGLMFGDYYYFDRDHLPTFESQQGFWFRRIYLTMDYTLTPKITTRLRFESASNGDLAGGAITPFVKDAYLKWSYHGPHQLTLGIHPSLSIDFVESFWGLRHIERTPLDLYRWDSSRDSGLTLSGPINHQQTLEYAFQYGNDSAQNSETDKFKGYRGILRYETTTGVSVELFAGDFQRPHDGDRITEQLFVGWRAKEWGRLGALYSYQKRKSLSTSTGPDAELDVWSAFAVYDIRPKKWSVYARYDIFDDPCGADCPGIDYLPIEANEPFELLVAGVEWYLHPQVRFSPNVELVSYDDVPPGSAQPDDDNIYRLTFYWNW